MIHAPDHHMPAHVHTHTDTHTHRDTLKTYSMKSSVEESIGNQFWVALMFSAWHCASSMMKLSLMKNYLTFILTSQTFTLRNRPAYQ